MSDDKQYVHVRVGVEEVDLLGLLMEDSQFIPSLRDAGYNRSILKLEALYFIHSYEMYSSITETGRAWFNNNVRILDKDIDNDE